MENIEVTKMMVELRSTCLRLAVEVNQGQEMTKPRDQVILDTAQKFYEWINFSKIGENQ
jgi:hypothetical protein